MSGQEMSSPRVQTRFSIEGKKALVTGGSKGIGAVTARVFAEAGADVAIVGRDRKGLEAIAAPVRAVGKTCLTVEADLNSVDGPQEAAEAALNEFGRVDILINNAGIAPLAPLLELSIADWDATLVVNLRSPFLLARTLVPAMIEGGGGKIVNVSSQAGLVALADHAAYSASKGGLNMLTKTMALEWGPFNINTNAVAPTVILTPMAEKNWGDPEKRESMLAKIPLRRFGTPTEVADLILFLASPASDLICGEVVYIDGGYTAL